MITSRESKKLLTNVISTAVVNMALNKTDRDIRRQALIALIRRKKNRCKPSEILQAQQALADIEKEDRADQALQSVPNTVRKTDADPAQTLDAFIVR